jgi:hypothetical protein
LAILAAMALTGFGCGEADSGQAHSSGNQACTLIGCGAPVTVTVDQGGERQLETCVGAVCSPPGSDSLVLPEVQLGDAVEVVVRVSGGGDEVARLTARPTESRPNGEGCGPVCRAVRLRLTVEDQLVPV